MLDAVVSGDTAKVALSADALTAFEPSKAQQQRMIMKRSYA